MTLLISDYLHFSLIRDSVPIIVSQDGDYHKVNEVRTSACDEHSVKNIPWRTFREEHSAELLTLPQYTLFTVHIMMTADFFFCVIIKYWQLNYTSMSSCSRLFHAIIFPFILHLSSSSSSIILRIFFLPYPNSFLLLSHHTDDHAILTTALPLPLQLKVVSAAQLQFKSMAPSIPFLHVHHVQSQVSQQSAVCCWCAFISGCGVVSFHKMCNDAISHTIIWFHIMRYDMVL